MRTLHHRAALAAAAALTPAVHADIVWTGAVSSDVFDEANWDLSNSTVTTIDPYVGIEDDIVSAKQPANEATLPQHLEALNIGPPEGHQRPLKPAWEPPSTQK